MRAVAALSIIVACAAAISLARPPAADALTRQQANAIAVKALQPARGKGPVVLFGLPKPLGPKDTVVVADPPPSTASRQTYRRAARPLGHRAWLYWEDLRPGGLFAHKSRLLLVDDRTGRVERNVGLRWFPLVNGRKPAFLGSLRAYSASRYRVFARLSPAPKKQKRTAARLPASAWFLFVSPDVFKNDCLILAGDFKEPIVAPNFGALAGFAHDYGLPVYWATSSGGAPADEPPSSTGERAADGDDLAKNVRYLVTKGCRDVFIYVAGHGSDTGAASITSGLTARNVDGRTELTERKITSADIAQIVEDNPEAQFKLAFDSCFSGRFMFLLRGIDNIRVIETSSAATEVSLGFGSFNADVALMDNPAMMSWFTNALVHGLREYMESDDEAKAEASGQDVLAKAVENAHRLGNITDWAALDKQTHPQSWVNGKTPAPKPLAVKLTEASHVHPSGASISLICAKVKTEPGASVRVTASGVGPVVPGGRTVTADANGDAIVSLYINRPGEYIFSVTATRLVDGTVEYGSPLTYSVPSPIVGPEQGPFECPLQPPS